VRNMSALAPRMNTQHALALPSPAASNTVVVNARCSLRIEADQRVIVVAQLPVHHYRAGDPLLVITREVDAALTKALPRLLREGRDVVGERKVSIVFDRGGWNPKLFATMIKDGFDVLTYRKGPMPSRQ
jgi:hypothetical protein